MYSPLTILQYPHESLRRQCREITEINDDVRALAENMLQTMYAANGIGLAAPQVGQCVRLIVVDVEKTAASAIRLANPRVIHQAGEISLEEGCLSIPQVRALVPRAQEVVIGGTDMNGKEMEITATDLLAVCLQHEIDHLNGVLFFDHLSRLKRNRLLEKYKKQQEQASDSQ